MSQKIILTITALTKRIIIEILLAHVANFSIKIVLTIALTIVIASDSIRSMRVAIAGQTFGKLIKSSHTLIAALSSEILEAWTLSVVIAN